MMHSTKTGLTASFAIGGLLAFGQAGATTIQGDDLGDIFGWIQADNCAAVGDGCGDFERTGLDVDGGELIDPATSEDDVQKIPGSDTGEDSDIVHSYNLARPEADMTVSGFDTVESDVPGESMSAFDFYWGSVDSFNTLSFYSDGDMVGSLTGSDLAATVNDGLDEDDQFTAEKNGNYGFDRYVEFTGQFDEAVFESGENAFEVARVPAPGMLALLGAGLLGMGLVARRRVNG